MNTDKVLSLEEFDQFVARLRATLSRAEEGAAIRTALTQFFEGAPTGRPAARAAKPAPARAAARTNARRPRAAGRPAKMDAEAVLARIAASPNGLPVIDLRKAFGGVPRHQVHVVLQRLREEGRLTLVGNTRAARWVAARR